MSLLSGLKLDARQILIASLPSDLPDSFFCGPSDVNGTALCSDSVVPGPGVRIPAYSSFVGPCVPHYGRFPVSNYSVTGGLSHGSCHGHVLRDESYDLDCLDAPDYVARGAVDAVRFSRFTLPNQAVQRDGVYA